MDTFFICGTLVGKERKKEDQRNEGCAAAKRKKEAQALPLFI